MPFGITWAQYLQCWGVSIAGFVCGSQLVHSIYKPLDNVDELVEKEAEKIRQSLNLKKPTSEEKLLRVLKQDEEYRKFIEGMENKTRKGDVE